MTYTKEQAMKLITTEERTAYMLQVFNRDYTGESLLDIARAANSWDGSFDWCEAYDLDEIADMLAPTEFARAIIYGNVENINDPVRFNGYGNLETVKEWELEDIAEGETPELAAFVVDNFGYSGEVDENYFYADENDVFDAWRELDETAA